jgi:hypothetical protein
LCSTKPKVGGNWLDVIEHVSNFAETIKTRRRGNNLMIQRGVPQKGYRRQSERQNHMKTDKLFFALITERIKKKVVCQTSYG